MARKNTDVNSSSFEILQDDIEYGRKGGCFVTTNKALIYFIITIASSVIVGVAVYYYGPKPGVTETINQLADIDTLINASINSMSEENIRLPTSVQPLYYRLKVHPVLDNFTFSGDVTMFLRCTEKTKTIELNSEHLQILSVKLMKSSIRGVHIMSVRSVPDVNGSNVESSNLTANVTSPTERIVIPTNAPPQNMTTLGITANDYNGSDLPLTTTQSTTSLNPIITNATTSFMVPVNLTTNETDGTNYLSTSTPSVVTPARTAPPTQTSPTPTITTKLNDMSTNSATTTTPTQQIIPSYNIEPWFYFKGNSVEVKISSEEENKINSRYVIHLKQFLKPGDNYTLHVSFSGNISDSLKGLYKSGYVDENGQKQWLISTQFGPVYARRAFPCFDEPSFKAPFEISVARTANMSSLSNMPLKETETLDEPGWVMDHFYATPPMPTYLVGFTVSDFKNATINEMEPKVTVWVPPNNEIAGASHVLQNSLNIVGYFESYFGKKYPVPKLDLVAIPELPDVVENLGLLSFNARALLSQRQTDPNRKSSFDLLARELSQQWFGNTVSIKWWADLWLSKGFAIFMAEEAENTLGNWTSDFTLKITQYVLNIDDFKSRHSLNEVVSSTLKITHLFDMGLHYKGSCLLRMLNHSLSQGVFKSGVQNFFNKWWGKSASEIDFWNSISENVTNPADLPQNTTLAQIMASWTSQKGYPVVTIVKDYVTGNVNISQSKFKMGNESDVSLWIIPLSYVVGGVNGGVRKLWLSSRSTTVANMSSNVNTTWVLFNIEQTGFYRVNYDTKNWKLLIQTLERNPDDIGVSNRAQLLNDAFELAENGLLNYSVPFELARYLRNERNYLPWSSVLSSLNFINSILYSTHLNGAYEDYINDLVSKLYDYLETTTNESENDQMLRKLIVKTACNARYQPCLDWANAQFHAWMNSSNPDDVRIQYDVRETVFCTAISMGGRAEWEFLWGRVSSTRSLLDKERFMSLGCSRDPWLINRYLEYTLNGMIKWQKVPLVWKSLSRFTTISVAFKFLRENWDRIYRTYKDKTVVMRAIVTEFLYALSSKSDLEDLRQFFSMHENELKQLSPLIKGVVDRIRVRVSWTENYMNHIASWLTTNSNN